MESHLPHQEQGLSHLQAHECTKEFNADFPEGQTGMSALSRSAGLHRRRDTGQLLLRPLRKYERRAESVTYLHIACRLGASNSSFQRPVEQISSMILRMRNCGHVLWKEAQMARKSAY